jgi:hypothetical protein
MSTSQTYYGVTTAAAHRRGSFLTSAIWFINVWRSPPAACLCLLLALPFASKPVLKDRHQQGGWQLEKKGEGAERGTEQTWMKGKMRHAYVSLKLCGRRGEGIHSTRAFSLMLR